MMKQIQKKEIWFSKCHRGRGVIPLLGILILGLTIPTPLSTVDYYNADSSSNFPQLNDSGVISSVGSTGNDIDSVMIYSRKIQNLNIDIMNSFANTSSHSESIDLSSYQLPGWTLYEVKVDADNITAIAESEILGASKDVSSFKIEEYNTLFGWSYTSLAQGFYEMPHDGQLLNYSFYYDSPIYSPAQHGWAYYSVLSDYQDSSSNVVGYTQLPTRVISGAGWQNTTVASVILDADTEYYVIINGSALTKTTFYPDIRWIAETAAGAFTSQQYDSRFSLWGTYSCEALLNYTYIPWNTTANESLVFSDPSSIALNLSGTPVSGSTWTISSASNITSLQISTNQSVSIDYDLTLRYKQDTTSTVSWYASTSGTDVEWNITSILDYPELSGSQDKNLILVLPDDWTANHLINITNPTQYYDHFSQTGTSVEYTNLADETWILKCTSPNYLQSLSKFDTSDDSSINYKVSVSVTMDINATIESSLADPATNGKASLRVFYQNSVEYAENYSVTAGKSYHQWDISNQSSSNGLHTIDLYWTNGTEVGYLTSDVLVYYGTTLVADDYSIDAFTDDTFYIGIDFDQVFPVGGIDASAADVTYSFGSVVNQSLTDQRNGRWDATVSTTSMTPGTHTLNLYAVGYALENRSITIDVSLIHDTQILTILWSNTNDISYVETTELSVAYNQVGGTPISGASVNVTIGSTVWQLNWDGGSGTYKMLFNGTDVDPGFGTHSLTIDAGKADYKPQSDNTEILDVHEESTIFNIEWTGTTSITYVESVTLYLDYQMSNTTGIPDATVEITIDSDVYVMNWNDTSKRYWYQFNGNDLLPGFGINSLTIEANKFGYQYQSDLVQTLTITEEPTTLVLSWSNTNSITYINSTTLIANFTQSNGSPVIGAAVNVSVGTGFWPMDYNPLTFVYELTFNGTDTIPGYGTFGVTVLAGDTGFVDKIDSSQSFTCSLESTSITVIWSNTNGITFIEQTTLIVSYRMSNNSVIPIDATVNVTIGGTRWDLNWDEGTDTYRVLFLGSDVPPGYGVHSLTIRIGKYGYENHVDSTETLTLSLEPTNQIITWSNTNSITFIESTILSVNYTQSDGSPITGATINATIVGFTPWILIWDEDSKTYQVEFLGSDIPPGFGTHDLTIRIGKFGYVNHVNSTETLTLSEEPTTLVLTWSNTNSITYINSTTLIANFTQSNGNPVIDATVNVSVGTGFWPMDYNPLTFVYELTFNGTDIIPGFGTFGVTVLAGDIGFVDRTNSSQNLIVSLESTSITITWSNTNSITFIEQTTLIVSYRMSNNSVIPIDATVNVTTGVTRWNLNWDEGTDTYRVTFYGYDEPPGFGAHGLTIRIGKYGYVNHVDSTEILTLSEEPTSMLIAWLDSATITYLESTTLVVNYRMSDTSPISGATVTTTISGIPYPLTWHPGSQTYRYTFNGADNPPGIGNHTLTIDANRTGFVFQSDSGETLRINEVSTFIVISWSNTNTITFVESTVLVINYTMSDGTPVTDAIVNSTIGVFPAWDIVWDEGTDTYRVTFYGDDEPPGFGSHDITIRADKFGYKSYIDFSQNITLESEPTTLIVSWLPDNDITYLTSSILAVSYRMNDSSPISGAVVNVTIGGGFWPLKWSAGDQDYRLQINGTDVPPDLGTYTINIQASKKGFDVASNLTAQVTLREEPTNLVLQWANGINNPDFFSYTYLIVDYLYSGSSPVLDASLNVSINSYTFEMEWNITGHYQLRINGSDSYLGVGTNSITIDAGKYGYVNQIDSGEEVVIPVVPTKLSLVWTSTDMITYVEHTTLQAYYVMYNDSLILGASVNVTINGITLPLAWSSSSNSYERTFFGSDGSLGIATFPILVEASQNDFQSQSNSDETLTIQLEPTALAISWIGGDNITYFSQTTLSVQFITSNATPISTGTLNATINGFLWTLVYNAGNEAYEATILGNDARLGYFSYGVVINASSFGYVSLVDSSESLTIRLEDTYLSFTWVPSNTISYLDSTVFRIYYRYSSNNSPVVGAIVNATYLSPWEANYNNGTGAYEIIFTGSDFPTPIPGTHTLDVVASKANHQPLTDNLQEITISKESTYIESWWLDGNNTITFVENTTIYINYLIAASGISIENANVTVRIGTITWDTIYNPILELYSFTFTGDMDPPGLGSFGLFISASYSLHEGYQDAQDNSQILDIESASVSIDSYWIVSGTITYLQQTTLVVNYTLSDGEAIPLAQVNVTIGQTYWFAQWHEVSETYRLTFKGSDTLPGLGFHELDIRANRTGFDTLTDKTLTLNIIDEPTVLIPRWSSPNQNNLTYFEYTYLFVDYLLVNTTPITFASVNVTIDSVTWELVWNFTESAYGIRFNGSDMELGFGINSLTITALKHGYEYRLNSTETLTLSKDPTTIQITWSNGSDTTYIESTTLIVQYRMSNGTLITTGTLTATIGIDIWHLALNVSFGEYYVVFDGDMSPPGLGVFSVQINASAAIFATQSTSESLTLREEPTTANASWVTVTIDWTESIVLGIDYKDTYGRLIDNATQKTITIDGSTYVFQGTNGTYWMAFDNSFDVGHHVVVVNISKFGYEFAVNASISFDIVNANTDLALIWNFTTIDYLGQISLSVDYTHSGTGDSIPVGLVEANITIDGNTTLSLTPSGNQWTITLDGDYLDLGSHSVVVRTKAYGYNYAESSEILTVNEVSTISSGFTWTPSNLTIEYTDLLILVVDYTFAGGDVPPTAIVNATIEGRLYELLYSAGAWRISIPGSDLGVGVFDADISAWLYGYELRTFVTSGINVTLAANSFVVTWEPWDLTPTYIDTVNLSVVYTEDFIPIPDSTIRLYINGSVYDLTYSPIDEMWHFSIDAATIDLGVWNVTVTANKTGYAEGYFTDILTVVAVLTTLSILDSGTAFYFGETTTVDIYYQLTNLSVVPGAVISFTLNSFEQTRIWSVDHWSATLNGTELEVGNYTYTIITSAYGYETQVDTIEITVLSIPTSIIRDIDVAIYAREFVSFRFTYIDDRSSSPIPATEFDPIWSEFYNLVTLPNFTYVVTIGGNDFHVGNYTFQLTLGRLGFDNSTGVLDIEVYPIPTQFVYETTYSQYENETILIEVQVLDVPHATLIDWAYVVIELEGVGYLAIYDVGNSTYVVTFRLPLNIAPGSYSLYLQAEAEDCLVADAITSLEVLAKSTYVLSLDVLEQVQAGSDITISVSTTEDNQPVQGISVTISIIVHLSEGDQQVIIEGVSTNSQGLAEITFEVPHDAIELEISASFQGSISEWPAETATVHVDVTPSGTGGGSPIVADPLVLTIITSGISLPILALAFRRRRRGGGRVSAPVSVEPVAPPPSPLSEMQKKLRDEIANSEEGITRAELSRRLGPSASKIGAMVKDLLNSDSGFYEVREGAKKIIKFRNPD